MNNDKTSSIVLNNVTVIDHAYIDDNGFVVGGSFHGSFHVTGKIDGKEKVVVDFSTIKKSIKNLIDDDEKGFDHKLWIIEGYSNICSINIKNIDVDDTNKQTYVIETPQVKITLPTNAVKIVTKLPVTVPEYGPEYIGYAISDFLTVELQKSYPTVQLNINTILTNDIGVTQLPGCILHAPRYFRYVHGLKDSTSWGCQNIAHGHLSFIVAYTNIEKTSHETPSKVIQLLNKIVDVLDLIVFVNKENFNKETISYTTEQRGYFEMTFQNKYIRHVVLDTETTIEFITEFVKETWGDELQQIGVTKIIVSEGLTKGCIIDIPCSTNTPAFRSPEAIKLYAQFSAQQSSKND